MGLDGISLCMIKQPEYNKSIIELKNTKSLYVKLVRKLLIKSRICESGGSIVFGIFFFVNIKL